jgi:hypothetical protein
MLTADTITDEQIRELLMAGSAVIRDIARVALAKPVETDPPSPYYQTVLREWCNARDRCAEIINKRPAPNDVADERKR